MTTATLNSEKDFKKLFNFNLQPHHIKAVNGITVNVFNGTLIDNQLSVSHKYVTLGTYSVKEQSTNYTVIDAPFLIEY